MTYNSYMKLQIPYLSQHQDVKDTTWHNKSCGIVCVKMILDFLRTNEFEVYMSVDDVITEGISIGGYKQDVGWSHESLVRLFRNRGINAYPQEFVTKRKVHEEKLVEDGLQKIVDSLKNKKLPVIVSVKEGFSENTFSHLIVLTGFEMSKNKEEKREKEKLEGFYCHDPDAKVGEKSHIFIEKEKFLEYWRRFVIFVEK